MMKTLVRGRFPLIGLFIVLILTGFWANDLFAQTSFTNYKIPELIQSKISPQTPGTDPAASFSFHYQFRIIAFLFFISLIPFAVMMLTSFTRISIIFHFLRQALGAPQVPSNQIVIGISLILTGFVMHPVINEIHSKAIIPYLNNTLKESPAVKKGHTSEELLFVENAWTPLRQFLLRHSREQDLELFLDIAHIKLPAAKSPATQAENIAMAEEDLDLIPWYCIVPAFVLSELRIAFMIGFLLFLPFLIIDMVIASVLMSMGMVMLPPILVSTPFKLLLFILIDGWRLIIQQIVNGYYI